MLKKSLLRNISHKKFQLVLVSASHKKKKLLTPLRDHLQILFLLSSEFK